MNAMPDPKSRAEQLVARVQALVDARPAEGGHPLEWTVPAHHLGDMTTLAMLSLRGQSASIRNASRRG